MDRRDFIAALGASGLGALSGCGGLPGNRVMSDDPPEGCGVPDSFGANRGSLPADETPTDGIPPAVSETPPSRDVDPTSFDTYTANGTEVPLVPVEVARYWWLRGAARFADARDPALYDRSHVYGAVLSPAPGIPYDGCDPATYWPDGDRIICYCGCPHHLSSLRAAALIEEGFEKVYAIDEGFWEWHRRGFPVAGERPEWAPTREFIVKGTTDPKYANQTAWIRVPAENQSEATKIGPDGNFTLEPKFSGVSPATPVVIETPEYTVNTTLQNATSGVVAAES
ncbi:rhodanese-like domain-containing protein [Halarchaeum sp. P4]|uniref:rhodanese-like domain-containing protein n=1 Tax=Halarchaeum sp. P4 TaxID=3421639 RepID=UPI003EB9B788